jgi:serine/threonine protein phosphatase PrpC
MLTYSFPVLLKRGFIDGPKSLVKMIGGDFTGADLQDAAEYERAAAIGMSNKEGGITGVSAFMNNAFMNFGYTAGIITEAIVEEVGLSFLTGATSGATGGIQAMRTTKIIEDIGKGLGKIKTGAKAVKEIIPKFSTPTTARTFWESSRGKKLSSIGRTLNPLENTVDVLRDIRKSTKAGEYLDGLALLSKTSGSFYRDVRNINMAISESRLEAGMVENKIFHKLYDDHYDKVGKIPDSNEQYAMRQQAKKGSLETFYANAGIIYLTNQITFGNITNPKGGLNNFLKQTRKEIYEVGAKSGEKQFGTLGKVIFDNTKKAFVFEKNNLMNLAKSWWKQPGYATAKKTLGYFKANVSEGIQENLQEAIARANENHYIEAYKQQGPSASLYAKGVNKRSYQVQSGILGSTHMDDYWKELGKEFSAQGFETFMSGFMMGTFSKPLNNAIPFLSTQKARIFDKAAFEKWKKTKLEVTKGIVDNLNDINIDQLINSRLMNLGTQEKVSEIQKKGTKKEALDAEVDAFVSTMALMRRTGTAGVFIEKLNSMQELTDLELADAVKSLSVENVPKYRKRITNSIAKLKSIETKFKEAEDNLENPVDIQKISAEEMKTPEGQALIRLHNAWNKSVENFVYLNTAFEDTTKRMSSIYNNYLQSTSLATVDYGAAKVLFKPQTISRQLGILEQELAIERQKEDIPQSEKSKNVKDKEKQIDALKEFQNAQALFYGFYQRNETPTINLAKKRLKEFDDIKDPTQEQIDGKLNQLLGDITDEKKQVEVNKALKDTHDKYIRSLAIENNATIFQSSLDEAFNQLVDYYKLEFESRAVAEHIDLLTDPGEFLKLVLENEKTFERLDEFRNELHSEIVDREINKVALDQLLNALANNAPPLYMDKNQVIDILDNKKVPDFFTGHKQEIYNIGSEPYRQGKELIDNYITTANILTANIDPISGVEMTPEMKKSVEEVQKVFKDSKDIGSFKGMYLKDGDVYSRVSNVMSKLFTDEGYNRLNQVIKTKDEAFVNSEDVFEFNQENINLFIKELKLDVDSGRYGETDGGITETTLSNLKLELESLLKGEVLNSYQKEIAELESGKTKYEGSLVALENIRIIDKEIETLKSNKYNKEEITNDILTDVVYKVMPIITYEGGRVRGITADDMVRDFFDPQSELRYDNYKDKISEEAFIALFGESGHLTKLKERVASGDIYIFAKNLEITDNQLFNKEGTKLNNVGGAIDLIIVDKTGKKYIVDLKTGKPSKWATFLIPGDDNFNYKKYFENSMQQRAYSNLFYNKSNGKDIETLLLPISIIEDTDGYITEVKSIPDKDFKGQKTFDNLVDGHMFIKTDNNARIQIGKNKVKVTDIDKYIPRQSIEKEISEEKKLSSKEVVVIEQRKKDIILKIKALKRKANVDTEAIDELEDELEDVKKILKPNIAKKTPEEDEDKEFYIDLRKRKRAAQENIIETLEGVKEKIGVETDYVNNKGVSIKIKKGFNLPNSKITLEEAKQTAIVSINLRIEQLYRYDILNHERKDLVKDTIDNITGRVFNSEIGKIFDKRIDDWGNEGALQTIMIDSVYVTDEGNYGILARNLRRDKLYDMIVTPEGDVISHNNQGKIGEVKNPKVKIDDFIKFEKSDFARKKTDEDRAKEEASKKSGKETRDIDKASDIKIIDEFSAVTTGFINGKFVPRTLEEGLLHIDKFLEKTFGWSNVKTTHKIKTIKDKISESTEDVFTITADGTTFIVDQAAVGFATTPAGKTSTFIITLLDIVNAKENAEEKAPVTKSKGKIIQSIEPTIETIGNITFGTAGQVGENKNQDGVYIDTENGLYILADGMGGMGRVASQSPEQASSDVINMLKGTPVKTGTELLYEEFQKNPEMTAEEAMDFLGMDEDTPTAWIAKDNLSFLLAAFKGVDFTKTSDDKGYKATTTGAVSAVAKRVAPNKYKIEKVGDTVFFVVNKNGKVIQSHGLSTSASVDEAYMFSIKGGKPQMNSPKVDKFTIELKDGQTLVLATDFIETEKAMDDFIKTDFGKNIDFEKFQKENKEDDSTFIAIREESLKPGEGLDIEESSLTDLVNDINNENKNDTSIMYDTLNELYISQKITQEKYDELKTLLDAKANALLETTVIIKSGDLYTFKEALDSKNMQVGEQVRVQKLDGSKKAIIVKKVGRGNYKSVSLTVKEFESKIDFGEILPKEGTGKIELEKTGDILLDFLNDKKAQLDLDKSKKDYLDETEDNDIFNNCK